MRRSRMAIWILMTSMLAGCSTTGQFSQQRLAMPVGPSFVGGRGMQMFPTSEQLVANVKDAMSDIGMHSIHQVPEPNGATALEATTADNRSSRVTIQTTGARSAVSVKIGWFGDEPLTRAFLDRLATRQGTIPTAASDLVPATPEEKEYSNPIISRRAVPDSVMLRDRFESNMGQGLTPGINP